MLRVDLPALRECIDGFRSKLGGSPLVPWSLSPFLRRCADTSRGSTNVTLSCEPCAGGNAGMIRVGEGLFGESEGQVLQVRVSGEEGERDVMIG